MSPDAVETSGIQFDIVCARVPYAMVTPAFRARASRAAIAGAIRSLQFGCRVQMGSTMSNMSNAVVAGLRATGTGARGAGICSVCGELLMGTARLRPSRPAACRRHKAARQDDDTKRDITRDYPVIIVA